MFSLGKGRGDPGGGQSGVCVWGGGGVCVWRGICVWGVCVVM